MTPRPPEEPLFCLVMKLRSSASTTVSSASNMNSCGISGSGSAWSSASSSSSGFSGSSVSSMSSSVSSWRSWGGGGGGGICIISSSISGSIMYLERGAMTSLTASLRSSALTGLSLSAACARATSHANSSARWPWTPAREASPQRYSTCLRDTLVVMSSSRAKRIRVLSACSWSSISVVSMSDIVFPPNARVPSTASTRSLIVSGLASAESETAMRSSKCERSSASSGLKVAMRSGLHGYRTLMPSRCTFT
mmetsp:Transcript_6747/g.15781  ORF Transcript_6747/g.15781 Transcript_6747/m.15781 type:complete len:251 (+) Transcript_6747:917-1669(+)